jgi:hypothetical protein
MIKTTTTKATYRGVKIVVISDHNGHETTFACTNNSGKPRLDGKWFSTQGEAIANERNEIDGASRKE